MDLVEVMEDLATACRTVPGLAGRTFAYWPDNVAAPAAVVDWPDPLTYDATMARGADRIDSIRVCVLVPKSADARSVRDRQAAYANGSGERSIKAAIEAHEPTAYDSARVIRAEFGFIPVAGIEYPSITFFVDIIGQGV